MNWSILKRLTAELLLALATITQAAPVTIKEILAQDPAPTGSVTITETQECCEDKAGVPWWPFLFAAAVPFAFIEGGDDLPPEMLLPPSTTSPTPETTPEPVPEPDALALAFLGLVGLAVWRKRR